MKRGRKPTPTALKLLRGNPGKRPLPKYEPRVEDGIPQAPEWMTAAQRAKWDEVVERFGSTGVLTLVDADLLSLYVVSWCQWRDATDMVAKVGLVIKSPTGYPMPAPWVTIQRNEAARLQSIEAEMGMTPTSRTRVEAPARRPGKRGVKSHWDKIKFTGTE